MHTRGCSLPRTPSPIGLAAEERAREAEDDEIAGTLNRYVQKLQASLALLHSDDTAFD